MYGISDTAIDYVRERATANMRSTCRIERVQKPVFDKNAGRATPGTKLLIYEGICRIWETTGGSPILIGEDDVVMQGTQLSIPWDIDPVPITDDEVQILTSPMDTAMVGKRFVIDSSAKFGEMRPTRRFSVRGYQKR